MNLRLLFVFAAIAANVTATADDVDDVMRLLAERHHGEANFVEQHFLSLLQRPVESWGKLIYDAPVRLEKRTLGPHPESLLVDRDALTVQRGLRTRVLSLQSYPQMVPFVESIRATLAGDRASLERVFKLRFSGDTARWTLLLTPLDERMIKQVSDVRIEGRKDDLLQVEIRQPDGDRSLMTLQPIVGQ